MTMNINIISIFPKMFESFNYGIIEKAISNNIVNIDLFNPRNYTKDKHKRVDDRPYGGGPGMVMQIEPIYNALQDIDQKGSLGKVVYVTPKGKMFDQSMAKKNSFEKDITFISGRYEGIDQRIIDNYVDEEISIGDYVLSGGEFPIMVIIDAIVRLLPGVLGNAESVSNDSFYNGNDCFDCPHYSRPKEFMGCLVPDVLLNGDHKQIELWRKKKSLETSKKRRG